MPLGRRNKERVRSAEDSTCDPLFDIPFMALACLNIPPLYGFSPNKYLYSGYKYTYQDPTVILLGTKIYRNKNTG